MYSKS